jgi:ATP-dependent Clp protease ATP-binding subunit ClpA
MFTPEFRNRLDSVIAFAGLSQKIIAQVVDKFTIELEEQLADRNVHIVLDQAARDWLATKGYDPLFGARPLGRVIQEHIKRPLADELLFGKLAKGGTVTVTIKEDKPAFEISEALPKPPKPGKPTGKKGPKEPALVE